jgi:hypothetical protein
MPDNFKTTRDFYLASYLVAVGIKLQFHNKINNNTVFNFLDDTQTKDAIDKYYSMSSSVEPIAYSNAIKACKSIVHSYDSTNTNTNTEGNNYVKQNRNRK